MVNHGKRGRVILLPLDSAYRRYHYRTLASNLPKGWTAEALCEDGLLARSGVGTLAVWQGDRIVSIDRRKAQAALDARRIEVPDRVTTATDA